MKFIVLLTVSLVVLSSTFTACTHVKAKPVVKVIADRTIIADIDSKIKKDIELSLSKIKVDCDKGNVTLSGRASNKQAGAGAEHGRGRGRGGVGKERSIITNEAAPTWDPKVK